MRLINAVSELGLDRVKIAGQGAVFWGRRVLAEPSNAGVGFGCFAAGVGRVWQRNPVFLP